MVSHINRGPSRKSWGAHSARWQREARNQGLSPERWNRWRRLSASTRRETDPRRYAAGVSVKTQRREKAETRALNNMKENFPAGREATMRLGVKEMTNPQLKWTENASFDDLMSKATVKPSDGQRNPWWYR